MIELKFEYFRDMEEVVEALLRNGYKVMIEILIDKSPKTWKRIYLLTAEKTEPKEITGETE
ncbi:MAG: hypothetical protein IKD59_05510 [Lachnospiraceae bacterium]|nr:hypothetical protein [Lachnospiraceae bacterium]